MAYLQQNNQDDPNNQQGASGGTSLTSGGSALTGGGSSAPSSSQSGNQFGNLQGLMNLNQNAPNTASTVKQNVQQGQQEQQNNVSQTNQNIGQSFNYNQNDMNSKVQNNDFAGLKQQLATTYQGPQAGSINVGPQNQNQISQQTQALGSTQGQQALLANQYGRSDYTNGEQKLDNFLQGRNNQFQQDAAQARNQGNQLSANTSNQNQALNQKAATTAYQTQQGVNNLKQGLGDTAQGFQTSAQTAADAANQQDLLTQQKATAAKNALAGGTSNAADLAALGFDPSGYTYGVNLGDYVNYKGSTANANNIMSKDDANRYSNINGLLGNQPSNFDQSLAGTYQAGQESFDKDGLQKALAGGQQAYTNSFLPQQQKLDNANQIVNLVNQRDQYQGAQPGTDGFIKYAAIQKQLDDMGAANNGVTRADWAKNDLLANAQKQYDEQKQLSDSQYLKKVGVNG